MPFDPTLAAIRFGTGLSPRIAPASTVDDLLLDLIGPDLMAERFAVPGHDTVTPSLAALMEANRARRAAGGTELEEAAADHYADLRVAANGARLQSHLMYISRALESRTGLRERLASFWADHFTVKSRNFFQNHLVAPYAEDAIRPHVTGRFQDMLKAVVLHPMMLLFLEQWRSTGPNSEIGLRMNRGLNENLARELLELHTMGVDGSYQQGDVRELAELLTGLVYHAQRGFSYDDRMAEPGRETVLGVTFGREASLRNILDALELLAMHPETAQHLAHKMAVHFISPTPDPGLVAQMAQTYLETEGNLLAMTAAMVQSDAAWAPEKTKVRLPMEYINAGMRALGVSADQVSVWTNGNHTRFVGRPLVVMGQRWERPVGPDGWSEDPADWIIPQAMAGRISWALRAPRGLVDELPDPRDFAHVALGSQITPAVQFAASAAETRREGVAIVLASAAFQRR